MENLFKVDGEYWVNSAAAAQLLGVKKSHLQSWHWNNGQHFSKTKDPDNGRRVGYNLRELIQFLGKLETGFMPSKTFEDRQKLDPQAPIFSDLAKALDKDDFEKVFAMSTGTSGSGSVESSEDVLIIGEGVASIRSGVKHIVEREDDMSDSEFERQLDHVEKVCFGWADETNDECTKNCRLFSACAEERNKHLSRFAEEAEAKDASKRKFHEMENRMSNIQSIRDEVGEDFEKVWGNE